MMMLLCLRSHRFSLSFMNSAIRCLASIPLPDGEGEALHDLFPFDVLQGRLFDDYRIEVPVIAWPAPPKRLIRISAQIYNRPEQYAYLADALRELMS